ncbi:MAG: hypothetical protein QOC60_241 [Frankiaceae bacterium]|jgi:3D (Asp-Asp-Asp) domain-containing protein|nr:hypothetical protein [Frankiaceae bacterium]
MKSFATRVRRLACLASALTVLCTLSFAPVAHADTPSIPQLLDVQLSETAVTVSGLASHDVVVRLHLTSYTGIVQYTDMGGGVTPSVVFERTTAGRGQVAYAPPGPAYTLVSGNAEDGWWEGTVHVTAGYDGTFTVTRVWANQANGVALAVDPRTLGINAQLQVTGVNIPHLTIKQSPDPVVSGRDLTLFGSVTAVDTGVPIQGARVAIGFDTNCSEGFGGLPVTTAADGSWREIVPRFTFGGWANCAFITAPNLPGTVYNGVTEYVGIFNFNPDYRETLSARLAARSVRVGGKVLVTGVSSGVGSRVQLQRIVGRTWRTVGAATVRMSGRFTLTAQPPTRGRHTYRVLLAPTVPHQFASTSATMVLVAF